MPSIRAALPMAAVIYLSISSLGYAQDIVLRASDVSTLRGNWSIASDASAAGGRYLVSADQGWGTTAAPLASPSDYFELTLTAPARTQYHVWFRLRAAANSKWNDSVWVQYSDALSPGGAPVYRIGTTSALDINLERCSNCGVSGWGWQDGAYWLSQETTIQFANAGSHTIRIQTREDGVHIDQIVLSPTTYRTTAPGGATNDATIVPAGASPPSPLANGPYSGAPVSLPGRIEAEHFDVGPHGVAYHDNTAGNAGGAHRQSDADIEGSSAGGFNLGWIEAGEWANYAVSVGAAGSYTAQLRVASPGGGGMLHVGFNGPSSVWQSVSVPATGGWQAWTTVSLPVTLGAGQQLMTLSFDRPGFNIDYIDVVAGSPSSAGSGGANVSVVTWNAKIGASDSRARGTIDALMNLSPRPEILILQEVHRSLYAVYIEQLRARTGQGWQGVFQNHCPPGAWNGTSCTSSEDEGVAVFTSLPVVGTSTGFLPYSDQWHSARGFARAAVNVNGIVTHVFSVHLQSVASSRYSSMSYLKSVASNYPLPHLVGGDFNADPDQIDTTAGMGPHFVDSWFVVGSGRGLTANTPSPTMKLDYLFSDDSGRARPVSTRVVTETGTFSDHYPVAGTFTVR